jgi:hypothetical protein
MDELKTKVNEGSVIKFLDGIEDEAKRKDSYLLFEMMQKANKDEPKMWGDSIVGFGEYHYVGKSGREGDWFMTGFSPRKQALTLYALGHWDPHAELLAKLGKYSLGKGCLYIKRLSDVDMSVLNTLIVEVVKSADKLKQTETMIQAKSKK